MRLTGSASSPAETGARPIWSTDGEQLVELVGHRGAITDVAFSPDGDRVGTSSRDETARVWEAESGARLRRLVGHRDDVTSVAFSPDGRLVLTASRDHEARLWNAEPAAPTQVLRWHFGQVSDASFSPDGRWILTAGPATVVLWQPGRAGADPPVRVRGARAADLERGLRSKRPDVLTAAGRHGAESGVRRVRRDLDGHARAG